MKREIHVARDGKELNIAIWDDVESPKLVVHLVHGMSEHIARYDEFASLLNENGIIAFGDDHRGHGLTDADSLGKASDDIYMATCGDMAELNSYAKKKWGLPIAVMGHSYGSFLSQTYIKTNSEDIVACILSGSALYGGGLSLVSLLISKFTKSKKEGKLFANMTFGSYDKKIGEGKNAWLCRDTQSVDAYEADPLCGYTCSNGFYKSFFKGLRRLSKGTFDGVAKDLPIMVAYGSDDYVGEKGKLIDKLVSRMQKAGLSPSVARYEGARHEILNETNKQQVMQDMVAFLLNYAN